MLPPGISAQQNPPVSKDSMEEVEYLRLEAWYNRYADELGDYHPEAHWLFACHAAFPVLLTPELLYKLWLNFRTFPDTNGAIKYIPYVAVSDLLLSDLIKEVSAGMYEMSPGIRFALLQYLQQAPLAGGSERMRQIADFVRAWTAECLTGTDDKTQAFRETQQWAIEVYLNPETAIRQVYDDLQKAYEKQDTHAQLRLNTRLENLDRQYKLRLQVNPQTDYASRLEHLLNYSRGTKNLLYDRTEAAITAFSRIPEPDLQKSGKGTAPGGLLTIPREVGGKLRREKQGPGHDGEQIYALLIGIDEYQDTEIPKLNGCVNDARAMADYLRKYHNDKDLRILTLTNQEATYENIIKNLSDHFRLAGPEDVVLIYFAGHADLPQPHLKGNKKDTSSPQEPGLVCYNSTRSGDEKILYNYELVNLLDEAGKRQPHMAILIDSNFGNRMTKTASRPGISKHVLLSATSDDRESANEAQSDGKTGGLFTRSLLQILETYEGNISYTDLISQVQALVKNRSQNQTPALIPVNAFDISLGFLWKILPEKDNFNRYQVLWNRENGWELAAGVLEGLKNGDRLQIIEGPEVSFEVRSAGLQISQLSLYGELPEDEGQFYYVEKNPANTDRLRVQADENTQKLIHSLGLEEWVYFVGPYDEAQCFIDLSDGKIKIRSEEKSSAVEIVAEPAAILDAFRQIRRWHILSDLQNPDPGIFPEDFWVEFFAQKQGEPEEILTGDDVSLTIKRFGTIFLRAMAGNRMEKNLHLALFHLGENFSITPLGNQMFRAGEETDFFFETGTQYEFSVSPGHTEENLTIQAIITYEKIDHYALQQNGLLRIPSQTSSTR